MAITKEEYSKLLGYGFMIGFCTGLTTVFVLYSNWFGTIISLFLVGWAVITLNKKIDLENLQYKAIDPYRIYEKKEPGRVDVR